MKDVAAFAAGRVLLTVFIQFFVVTYTETAVFGGPRNPCGSIFLLNKHFLRGYPRGGSVSHPVFEANLEIDLGETIHDRAASPACNDFTRAHEWLGLPL
jgi:hypothetical protein